MCCIEHDHHHHHHHHGIAAFFSVTFQCVECIEKIAEVADEAFHLLGAFIEQYTDAVVFQTLSSLHDITHEVEHVLHAFCLGGDITRLIGGRFIVYHHDNQHHHRIDYLRTLARVCHLAAHLLASLEFLNVQQICSLAGMERYFAYGNLFSATGYAIWTIQLVWNRFQENADELSLTELFMQAGGFLFEAVQFINKVDPFNPYLLMLNPAASIAGIIHASLVVHYLVPTILLGVGAFFETPENVGSH